MIITSTNHTSRRLIRWYLVASKYSILRMNTGEGQTKLNKIFQILRVQCLVDVLTPNYYINLLDNLHMHRYYSVANNKHYSRRAQHQLVLQLYIPTAHRKNRINYIPAINHNLHINTHITNTHQHGSQVVTG